MNAGLPSEDVALWEVLLDETTAYQSQPQVSKEEREELVNEVSGNLMEPGSLDPNVDIDAGEADAPAPRMTKIASGEQPLL